jgi:hypothetical protein
MQAIRHQALGVAAGWLVLQLAVMTSLPFAQCAGQSRQMAAVESVCVHSDDVECPVHHAVERGSTACSCGSTTDESASALTSLLDTAAVLTAPTRATVPLVRADSCSSPTSHPADTLINPDSPPPRA